MRDMVLALVLALAAAGCARTVDSRPNVVVVMTDDQRAETLAPEWMPATWRRLVLSGVRFQSFFTTTATCCPSRVAFLTGNYASRHGVHHNTGEVTAGTVDQDTLVTRLHAAGYRTGICGKYLNNYNLLGPPHRPTWYVPPGWDAWTVFGSGASYVGYTLVTGPATMVEHGLADADYSTDVLRDCGTRFIADALRDGVPFFLLVTPFAPHDGEFRVPARHRALGADLAPFRSPAWGEADVDDKGPVVRAIPLTDGEGVEALDASRVEQFASLRAVDEMVEALLLALPDAPHARGNTVFVVTSDNGVNWYEHRLRQQLWSDEKALAGRAKNTPYDGAHRVPLVLWFPSRFGSRERVEPGLATMQDLSATLATLAGIAPPGQDGLSFAAQLAAGQPLPRATMPWEGWNPDGTVLYSGWRTATAKEFRWGDGFLERYDLIADPYELENLAVSARPPASASTTIVPNESQTPR